MHSSTQHPAILAYSIQTPEPVQSDGVQWVPSALACLNQATSRRFDMILIRWDVNKVFERAGLIELVACLRHHPASHKVPVLVTLDDGHRDLVVKLKAAGLALIEIRGLRERFDPATACDLARRYPARFDIHQVLSRLCPYLNYPVFDGVTELTTCGACRNRMVLGGERLRSVCQTSGHACCDYFCEAAARP